VVLCGSSFKVGSNDIRVSKTLELVLALQRYKMLNVALLDELAAQEIQRGLPSIELIKEPQILPTDAVVIVLKDQSYTKLASRTDKQNLLNIPLL
jgi:UDP-N-acetyl-D-mannosaminuronate dehydrogenase